MESTIASPAWSTNRAREVELTGQLVVLGGRHRLFLPKRIGEKPTTRRNRINAARIFAFSRAKFGRKISTSDLGRQVERVLANDNCTGCGVCTLISPRITIELNDEGFNRPIVADTDLYEQDQADAATFAKVCPGVNLRAPVHSGSRAHPVFGRYVEAWQGWAADPEIRHAGSSGGVLTALADWLVSTGRVPAVAGSGMSCTDPTRTVPIRITSRDEALAAAGSRYAPVANGLPVPTDAAFIGKPCEVSGRFQLAAEEGQSNAQSPILLSFFCAGTPSQHATDELARALGVDPIDVAGLRYRGNGWPGQFEVRAIDGRVRAMSYEASWGETLGRRLQTRCKLCVDGTGEHADISVGDYWTTDAKGFPLFADAAGNSVVIARTRRGAELLAAAMDHGVIHLQTVRLDEVAAVQPLQTQRRLTLAGRLVGRQLSGHRVPRFRGYKLLSQSRNHLGSNIRAAAGTFARSTGLRK